MSDNSDTGFCSEMSFISLSPLSMLISVLVRELLYNKVQWFVAQEKSELSRDDKQDNAKPVHQTDQIFKNRCQDKTPN
jgi:hypothetical protein